MIDILKMTYFIAIVESEFNLTKAAQRLFVSQPALSKFISTLEEEENLNLFERKNNKLIILTPAGHKFYEHAKSIISAYKTMLNDLSVYSKITSGTIKIGIPPLIMTVLFTEVIAQLYIRNPQIKFEIVEEGAFELRKKLLLNELDMAILITPTGLSTAQFKEELVWQDELTAFMSSDNELANQGSITWKDLSHRNLAIFNDTFMIHHQIVSKFISQKMVPSFSLTSGLWDYLVDVTKHSDFITIMPAPISKVLNMEHLKEVPMVNPIIWEVVLVYPIRDYYSKIDLYVRDSLKRFFQFGSPITALAERTSFTD